jgi:hypothetical protein
MLYAETIIMLVQSHGVYGSRNIGIYMYFYINNIYFCGYLLIYIFKSKYIRAYIQIFNLYTCVY